jgi:hypothetical protein
MSANIKFFYNTHNPNLDKTLLHPNVANNDGF